MKKKTDSLAAPVDQTVKTERKNGKSTPTHRLHPANYGKKPVGGARPGSGRKAYVIPYAEVEALGQLHPTDVEIRSFFKISIETMERWKKDPEYVAALERGMSRGKLNLRRRQLKKAEEGDGTMLVWLGKNMLGQADKSVVDNRHSFSFTVDLSK